MFVLNRNRLTGLCPRRGSRTCDRKRTCPFKGANGACTLSRPLGWGEGNETQRQSSPCRPFDRDGRWRSLFAFRCVCMVLGDHPGAMGDQHALGDSRQSLLHHWLGFVSRILGFGSRRSRAFDFRSFSFVEAPPGRPWRRTLLILAGLLALGAVVLVNS